MARLMDDPEVDYNCIYKLKTCDGLGAAHPEPRPQRVLDLA